MQLRSLIKRHWLFLGATHNLNTADLFVAIYDSVRETRNLTFPNSVSIDSTTYNVTVTLYSHRVDV